MLDQVSLLLIVLDLSDVKERSFIIAVGSNPVQLHRSLCCSLGLAECFVSTGNDGFEKLFDSDLVPLKLLASRVDVVNNNQTLALQEH